MHHLICIVSYLINHIPTGTQRQYNAAKTPEQCHSTVCSHWDTKYRSHAVSHINTTQSMNRKISHLAHNIYITPYQRLCDVLTYRQHRCDDEISNESVSNVPIYIEDIYFFEGHMLLLLHCCFGKSGRRNESMLPDRVSNPGPLTYESGALPIALRGPALRGIHVLYIPSNVSKISVISRVLLFPTHEMKYFWY